MSDYNIAPYSEDAMPDVISPEGAEIANIYLANACSLAQSSKQLNMPAHEISNILQEPVIKNYVASVLKEHSYGHMVKIASKLDELVDMKWTELEEAEIGSNKDIADLLQLAYKMRLDMSNLLQRETTPTTGFNQKNTQVNVYGEGNYGKLMEKLINA